MSEKTLMIAEPILESKGMSAIFQKSVKKGQNIWNIGQKCTTFENISRKGRWMCTIIACNKLLEKAVDSDTLRSKIKLKW